jgi:hypothetical protein
LRELPYYSKGRAPANLNKPPTILRGRASILLRNYRPTLHCRKEHGIIHLSILPTIRSKSKGPDSLGVQAGGKVMISLCMHHTPESNAGIHPHPRSVDQRTDASSSRDSVSVQGQ